MGGKAVDGLPRSEQMVLERVVGPDTRLCHEDLPMSAAIRPLQVDRLATMKCEDNLTVMRPLPDEA